ncbi:PREDICTED: zinc finger MYM-type protein 1-like [Nicotiana attenuata]|uniref:zinc finger MYM-type protein 1-like n=1 Tax=Nicotiana attenuata TaxID=49451 RepID=UPI000905BBD1|nr:PREDICTED: zinc finger MYM-type protein 1-like [Nicotiana attenuata]
MAIVLRYVDRRGSAMERFMGIVHVRDTTALSLRNEIVSLLTKHSLSPSYIHGQCYDGASNMQGDLNGLKILMQKESRGAHSIHCFAHQLQLTLVAVSRRCNEVQELLLLVSDILNMVGASFKRRDELRESQAEEIEEALRKGELETGKGLNQELGLARAGDTQWGSHYKSFNNFILMFGSIIDVLDAIAVNAHFEEKCKAKGYLKACLTFEIVFMLHLMRTILAITNKLSAAFQKKEQDIINAMLLVGVAKDQLQELRMKGWDSLINEVSKFCMKYDISIPEFNELYVIPGRSRHRVAEYTVSHHYRVEVFYRIIDWQFQELNSRFDEVTTDLLLGVACLNPADSFSNFDIEKILRLAELYPDDFDKYSMVDLRFQLQNYIVDVRDHDKRFSDLRGLGNLSTKLVETKKHGTYPLIFQLVKFALLLPVATATVERAFSAMKLIKTDLRSRIDDEFLSSCLVPYIEKDVFSLIPNEAIMNTFQNMKTRRGEL